ncbi:hypothetical protein BH10PLA1_BH10PLA1_15030 [soil metagenome]
MRMRPYLRLCISWALTAYLVTAGFLIFTAASGRTVRSDRPMIDAIEFLLAPLILPGILSDALHSFVRGFSSITRFAVLLTVVGSSFAILFWWVGRFGRRAAT